MKHTTLELLAAGAVMAGIVVLAFQVYGLRKDVVRIEAQRVSREVITSWGDADATTVVRTSKWSEETLADWRRRHIEAVRVMRADEELGR
jgi:hypothetical protein